MDFYVLNDVVYCDEHRPTSRLAELQMRKLTPTQTTRADRCYTCGAQPERAQ